jgi:hypothetical protein
MTLTATAAYAWLTARGQISGTSSALGNPSTSCLSWLGGNMPPGGAPSNPTAVSALQAWIAAGAPND